MRTGVIIELKGEHTCVLCKNAKIKKIKRQYNHEIGNTIELPLFTKTKLIPTAILACLIIIAVVINPLKTTPLQALSYVSLSVNPGLVFKIDENQKVTAVSYTNKEGNEMTQQIDFINHTLDDCVILFIDYCFENNYFQDNKNIDINVISDDQQQIKSLENQINETIQNYLSTHQISLTVSVDQVSQNQKEEAQQLGIPDSKLKLIDLILEYYPNLNRDALAKKSVDDLIEYLEDKGYDEDVLDRLEDRLEEQEKQENNNQNNSNQQNNNKISKEEAKKIALSKVNGKIKSIDYDDDDHEYEVEVIKGRFEYEIKIDAYTGKILEVEKDD